ncbi:MAG: uroporphyrinogen decarboxylase [Chloroflexi bacterium]|nr:uroporphyrinogen decarboxylase [Chloroflexota bacterium]
MTPWDRFATVARGGTADRVPVALIVDSPWLPGYAGVDTLDYFLREEVWLKLNLDLLTRFPEVAWIPGFWIEYGMAAEPSGFGARVLWHHDRPPSIEAVRGGLAALVDIEPPDPYEHGLMPLVLKRYADLEKRLLPQGIEVKMVTARGPFAVANWILGATDFMITLASEPDTIQHFLETLTTTIIAFLRAQLDTLHAPAGIMVLDDIMGMVSPDMFEQFVRPHFSRIFREFDGLVKVLHNDTPCMHLCKPLATLGFDVFNFSHEMDIATVQAAMPGIALMGNVPPYSVMAEGTAEQVETWARECIRKTNGRGLVLSAGGGVSPGTPASAIDALVRATQV